MRNLIYIFTFIFIMSSCVEGIKEKTASSRDKSALENAAPAVTTVSFSGSNYLVINGSDLDNVENIKLSQSSNTHILNIVSVSENRLVASLKRAVKLTTLATANLIVTSAYGASTFPLVLDVADGGITTAKLADGSVTSEKLNAMGASSGQTLIFDGTDWAPGNISGLSFKGVWSPSITAPSATPVNGDFYLVNSTVNNVDISDGEGARNWVSGDWIVYNQPTTSWKKISSIQAGNFLSKTGNDLYYNTGNFSIGTDTATTHLTLIDTDQEGVAGEGTTIDISYNDAFIVGDWAKGIAFGLNSNRYFRMGLFGNATNPTRFYISADESSNTPWNDGNFVIDYTSKNVGISTLSPTERLEVNGNVKATQFIGDGSNLTGVKASTINSTTTIDAVAATGVNFNVAAATRFHIDNTGNTSIGHGETPDYLLDVRKGGQADMGITSYSNATSTLTLATNSQTNVSGAPGATANSTTLGALNFSGHDGTNFVSGSSIESVAVQAFSGGNTGSNLVFKTTASGTSGSTEKMRLTDDGKLGLGDNNPTNTLSVTGSGSFTTSLSVGTTMAVTGALSSGALSASTGTFTGNVVVNTDALFVDATNERIGIGMSTPDDAVDVIGDVDATGCFQTGNVTTVGGACVSDERLKKDIVELDNSLELILRLRPVEYVWRPEHFDIHGKEGKEVGLIAQDVERIFPDLVEEKADGYKRVKYGLDFKIHLISAFKEFFNLFMDSDASIKRELASLKEENTQMKAFLCKKHKDAPFCKK